MPVVDKKNPRFCWQCTSLNSSCELWVIGDSSIPNIFLISSTSIAGLLFSLSLRIHIKSPSEVRREIFSGNNFYQDTKEREKKKLQWQRKEKNSGNENMARRQTRHKFSIRWMSAIFVNCLFMSQTITHEPPLLNWYWTNFSQIGKMASGALTRDCRKKKNRSMFESMQSAYLGFESQTN